MQDRYAGDIGDYGKLGMLRMLAAKGFSIGINWYLIETPQQELANNDGAKLIPDKFAVCDPELARTLQDISHRSGRSVREIQKSDLVPDACYYSEVVSVTDRAAWHTQALSVLAGVDLVFLDPDNGLLVKSVRKRSAQSSKYTFYEEVADYVSRGQSVVVYNHRSRKQPDVYFGEIYDKLTSALPNACDITAITFPRGAVRDYFAIAASPEHAQHIREAFDELTHGKWGEAGMCRLQPLPYQGSHEASIPNESPNVSLSLIHNSVCQQCPKGEPMEPQERPQDWIIETLVASSSTSPAELLEQVMADPRCPAFGPIHHFIVGATLLACWRNAEAAPDREALLRTDLEEMLARSSSVPGATCARWGVCGAAASAGMAYAIIRGNEPLRNEGWREGQLMVSDLLAHIARSGSPRCCKRDARVAIAAAVPYFNALGGPQMTERESTPACATFSQNGVCMGNTCPFHPKHVDC